MIRAAAGQFQRNRNSSRMCLPWRKSLRERFLRGSGMSTRWIFLSRCCLILVLFAVVPSRGDGQFRFREPPNRQTPGALSELDSAAVLEQFRSNRAVGPFLLAGELTLRPHRAPSQSYPFQMLADWRPLSERTELSLLLGSGALVTREIFLELDTASVVIDGAKMEMESGSDFFRTQVFEQLPITWLDLIMPFLQWTEVSYLGPERYLGRPAHRFLFLNPDPAGDPQRALVSLDQDFAALLKVDLLDAEGVTTQRIRVGGFRRFGENWMMSDMTWENRITRDSIRLRVSQFELLPQQ